MSTADTAQMDLLLAVSTGPPANPHRFYSILTYLLICHLLWDSPVSEPVPPFPPDPPEVSISGYDDNWYLGRSEATLSCDVRSNPEPTGYEWST